MRDRPMLTPSPEWRPLAYQDTYGCPVCRHGQISAIALMDAFACSFCRHIFTANLAEQSLRVEDSPQPMGWRWNGTRWKPLRHSDVDIAALLWSIGTALVVLPPTLVWLSSHTFPPLPGSAWAQFPLIWVGLTFGLHFTFVAWLLAEHYQVPLYVTTKVRLGMALGRR